MSFILIWTYHRVLPENSTAAVTPEIFDMQLRYMKSKDYVFLDREGIKLWFQGKQNNKKNYTVLTFDDGWADNLIWATPLLKKHNVKAIMALNTALVNPVPRKYRLQTEPEKFTIYDSKTALGSAIYGEDHSSFLTWEELEIIKNSGVWDIEAHGNSHLASYDSICETEEFYPAKPHWTMKFALGCEPFPGAPKGKFKSILSGPRTLLSADFINNLKRGRTNATWKNICSKAVSPIVPVETPEEYEARLKTDLLKCKDEIKSKLGLKTEFFFWPWGHYSPSSVIVAKESGYEYLFTMDKDAVTRKSSALAIPRIAAPASLKRFIRQERIFSSHVLRALHSIYGKVRIKK